MQLAVNSPAPVKENARTTTAEATDGGVLSSLGLNGYLFGIQFFNFALVACIVWFLILKPLTKKMEERKNLINDSLEKVKQVETNLRMSNAKFQEKIDEAKIESNKIIEHAHQEAVTMGDQMKQRAKDEIALLVQQAKKNIEIDREEMRDEVKKETVNLVVLVVEKLLDKKFTAEKDRDFIQDILKEVK